MSNTKDTTTCDECGSLFFVGSSQMSNLCPNCAHLLYGKESCVHSFVGSRCSLCYWDGSVSAYGQTLVSNNEK
ncbi:MAG TPA: hypothetical protein VJI96_02805 [Candidatus Andersenbacteria bacterium]|nr:hypothetical protein [Candidatus Andersenbacteria bacterium]